MIDFNFLKCIDILSLFPACFNQKSYFCAKNLDSIIQNQIWQKELIFSMHLYLVRHAQSCKNAAMTGYWHPDDAPLTERGKRQAELLSLRPDLQNVDAIYTSTLLRAAQTAYPLAKRLDLPITLVDDAAERDTAIFGTGMETMLAEVPCAVWRPETPCIISDKETPDMLRERAKRLIDYIVARSLDDDHVMLVTHCAFWGYPLRYLLHIPEDEPFAWMIGNTAVTDVELRKDGIPIIYCANDRSHLYADNLY